MANSSAMSVGQWYRVLQKDPGDGSLMWELNGGAFPVVEAQKGYADPCRCGNPAAGLKATLLKRTMLPSNVQQTAHTTANKFGSARSCCTRQARAACPVISHLVFTTPCAAAVAIGRACG